MATHDSGWLEGWAPQELADAKELSLDGRHLLWLHDGALWSLHLSYSMQSGCLVADAGPLPVGKAVSAQILGATASMLSFESHSCWNGLNRNCLRSIFLQSRSHNTAHHKV